MNNYSAYRVENNRIISDRGWEFEYGSAGLLEELNRMARRQRGNSTNNRLRFDFSRRYGYMRILNGTKDKFFDSSFEAINVVCKELNKLYSLSGVLDCYDFYKRTETEKELLVGTTYETDAIFNREQKCINFIIGLNEIGTRQNYNEKYGIISVLGIIPVFPKKTKKYWFKVSAHSPDDLDLSIQFNNEELHHRDHIIAFLKELMPLRNVSYREVFELIQDEVKAGYIGQ